MASKEELLETADLYVANEEALAAFYQACSTRLLRGHNSWGTWDLLVRQELGHASIFRTVKESIASRPDQWQAGRFHPQTLKLIIQEIVRRTESLLAGDTTLASAINFAVDTENSLVEADLAHAFATSDPDMALLLARVASETIEHRLLLLRLAREKGF